MRNLKDALKGYKLYATIGIAIVGVILREHGVEIPGYAWQILGLAGLGAIGAKAQRFLAKGDKK